MNKLAKVFNYGEKEVRTVIIENEPWFIVKDACNILNITNPTDSIKNIEEDDLDTTEVIDSLGRKQTANIVNESGLYQLIFQSRKPEAKQFKRWVTHEVLPSIRKHGIYATDELLNNPDLAIKAFTALKEERERNKLLESKVEQDKPKVLFAESVTASKDSVLVHELATILKQKGIKNMGEIKLFNWLRENGYLCKCGEDYNLPTSYSMELKLMEIKKTTTSSANGSHKVFRTCKVTGKGQIYFVNKILKQHSLATV